MAREAAKTDANRVTAARAETDRLRTGIINPPHNNNLTVRKEIYTENDFSNMSDEQLL